MKHLIRRFLKFISIYFFITLCCSVFTHVDSQSLDSKGTDFWLTFPGNYSNEAIATLFISGEANTTGIVTIPGIGFSKPFTVTAGNITSVILPADVFLQNSNMIEDRGIHVTASKEVTIYGLNRLQFSTDAYLGLPTDILGTNYINLGYMNVNVVNGTQFGIVATQNGTTVNITLTEATDGRSAGVPYNITLNQGQTYFIRNTGLDPSDLSGSIITSNKPIAVFGGHQAANIPRGAIAADHIVEELPPTTAWGKNFVTVPLKTRLLGDTYRFLSSTNGTSVSVNGTVVATLNRGQYYETILTAKSQITSTQPILVAQYSNSSSFDNVTSDPFMMLITPFEQFLDNYTFSTPASGFRANFVNVVAPAAAISALKLDGVGIPSSAFTPIGSSGFYGAQLDLNLGAHTINGTNLPFGIFVYGFDDYDSYGYPGGQSLAPIATVNSLTLTPKTGTTHVGSEQCFEALVKDQFNNPVAGVRVDFNITGPNSGSTGFTNTKADGIARFCYTGANAGTDKIVASVGTIADASTFSWTAVPVVYYSKPSGDLHNISTWGVNPNGSGANPPDFTSGKKFVLANRAVNYNLTGNWTVGGLLVNPVGSRLQISGFTLSLAEMSGTVSGAPGAMGTITGSTTSNLIITGTNGGNFAVNFTSGGGSLNNLTLNRTGTSASATIGSAVPLSIYGVLTVTSGALNTGNAITLKSSATNTARVAPVIGSINGNVTVERYIPARRAWRLMSAPVGGSQTISQAWQEGVTTASASPNPNPGYGTHITVGSIANGFDINPVPEPVNYSLRRYQSSTDSWGSVPNTNSTAVNAAPYMLFVRGDRGIALGYRTVAPTSTTLRVKGPLKTGNQTFAVSATGFTAIPNPFASPINFATITKTNVQNNFYVWDPKMGGTYGVGAYVNVFFNGTSWEVTPSSVSPESQFIQSGQGFLVHSSGGVAGSLVIKESDKSATPATNVFRTANTTSTGLRITLKSVGADNITSIHDEVFSSYSNKYSDKVDDIDALKVENMEENLAILKEGKALMVDRKPVIVSEDRIDLKLSQTSADKNYLFEFNPMNLSSSTLSAALIDNYLHTTTPLSLSEISKVTFKTDPQSTSASKRFTVVISSRKAVAPIDIVSQKTGVSILTNPVVGKVINLQFRNLQKGTYRVSMFNTLGQAVYQNMIRHEGGSTTQKVQLSSNLGKGSYQLHVTNGSLKYNIKVLAD